MNIQDFFNLFLIVSAIHGFVFFTVLSFSKEGKNKTLVYINFLVLAISLNNFQSWVLVKQFFTNHLFLRYFEIPWHFLIASFFYMFLIHYFEIEKRQRNILKGILSLFIVLLIIRLGFYYVNNGVQETLPIFKKYTVFEEVLSIILSFAIFGYSYYLYKLTISEKTESKVIDFDNLKWINVFFKLGLLAYVFWIIPLIVTLSLGFKVFLPSYYPLRVFTTVLIYWLGYQSIIQLRTLKERKYLRENAIIERKEKKVQALRINENNKNDKSINIPEEIVEGILKGLEKFEANKEYCSQNVTLSSLASELHTNTNYLSKVINHYKELSFSNYINTLRINNIIEQLEEKPIIRKFTIKAIALEAGFSSSDSFSKAFFKLKDMNPSEYIKKLEA